MSEKSIHEGPGQDAREPEQKPAQYEKMEEDLREKQIEHEALFHKAPFAMLIVNQDLLVCELNEVAAGMGRRRKNESTGILVGDAIRCLNALDDPKGCGLGAACKSCIVRKTALDTFQTGQDHHSVETSIPYSAEEGTIPLQVNISTTLLKSPREKRVIVYLDDITPRKKIEKKLEQAKKDLELSEKKYRRLAENAKDMIYRMSLPDGNYEYVSPASMDLFGYPPEKFYKSPALIEKIIHPDWVNYFKEQWADLLQGRLPPFYEYQILHPSGEERWMNQRNVLICNDNGRPKAIEAIVTDITQAKQTEEALRTSHERFLRVLDGIDANIYVADMESYEILFMNKNMIDTFGRNLTGEICWQGFRGDPEPCRHCTNDQLIDKNGRPSGYCTWQNKNPITGKWYINKDRAIEWPDGRVVRIQVSTDITKLKQMEGELHQAQKMDSISTLTGGIAHDFNNILGIIVGNAELALEDVPKLNPVHSNLEEIKTASLRAADIVRQLLSLTRRTDQKLEPLKIARVIKDALKFLRSTIPTTIDIDQDIQVRNETILADPTQINQIIMNLCINASHAMKQTGGKILVTVETISLDDNSIKDYPCLETGRHVKVTVSDTGPGIDPEIIDKVFDPYFTTREIGKGSGMGLAVVFGIVKNHSGAISVESTPGQGTKFTMFFPLAQRKAAPETDKIQKIPKGSETILFVDDEISIVKMVKNMFQRLGYKVETATTPQDALELFGLDTDHFDLVITDMTMPGMTGVNLSEKLMNIRPDIPIIICTGHSSLVDKDKAKALGLAAYVTKPINLLETAQTIRKVLDKK